MFLRLNLRKGLVLKMASLFVLLVERGTMGSFYGVPGVSLVVVNRDTKLNIVLLEMVSKFLLMFKKLMLQIKCVSMHSGLEDQSRMRMVSPCIFFFAMSSF